MQHRPLGRTGQTVSELCLGTMTWGEQNTEAEGHAQMDYALERGVSFFDTAEMYPIPPKGPTQGRTESVIGTWFAACKNRDKVILATKICGPAPHMTWYNEDGSPRRHNADQIRAAVEGSLRRLQTDYIDLYQLHWPDRPVTLFGNAPNPEQPETPIEETLLALGEMIREGKIRWIGLSNETPWGVMAFLRAAERHNLPRVQSVQNVYNLVARMDDYLLAEVLQREDVAYLPYSPLAQGYLTGKYRNGALPEGARKTLFDRMQRYEGPGAVEAIDGYLDIAAEAGLDPAQMAIRFVLDRAYTSSVIIGATSLEQLKTDIDAAEMELPQAAAEAIEALHRRTRSPAM